MTKTPPSSRLIQQWLRAAHLAIQSPPSGRVILPVRDALGGTYLSDKEPIMNSRTDDLSCIDPCNSIEFETHRSETHCVICGLSQGSGVMVRIRPKQHRPGWVERQGDRKPSTGSEIPLRFDRKFDRFSNLQKRETRQDVQFLEQIIGHVLHT